MHWKATYLICIDYEDPKTEEKYRGKQILQYHHSPREATTDQNDAYVLHCLVQRDNDRQCGAVSLLLSAYLGFLTSGK